MTGGFGVDYLKEFYLFNMMDETWEEMPDMR
jgi:hypothetical protein